MQWRNGNGWHKDSLGATPDLHLVIPANAGIQMVADAVNGRLSLLTPLSSL